MSADLVFPTEPGGESVRFRISTLLVVLLSLIVTPLSWADLIQPRSSDLFASIWRDHESGEPYVRWHSQDGSPHTTRFRLATINTQPRRVSSTEDSFLGSTLAFVELGNKPDRATPSFMQSAASQSMPSTFSLSVVRRIEADHAMEFFLLLDMGITSQLPNSTTGISTMVLPPASASPSGQSSWITLSTVNLGW